MDNEELRALMEYLSGKSFFFTSFAEKNTIELIKEFSEEEKICRNLKKAINRITPSEFIKLTHKRR